ncbi:RNA 2',3'-cyclic phosphodiesterase [Maricaulis sp. CAU 1757]
MSLRLFAALPVPHEIGRDLARFQKGVPGARWRPLANLHITLRFFGEISETAAADLDAELASISARPMTLRLRGADWFGKAEPRSLWIGVEPDDGVRRLAEKCERAARRAGLAPEGRKFVPHVTLAYLRGTPPDKASKFVERIGTFTSDSWHATHFSLYSSWLTRGDANIYEPEADYPLG